MRNKKFTDELKRRGIINRRNKNPQNNINNDKKEQEMSHHFNRNPRRREDINQNYLFYPLHDQKEDDKSKYSLSVGFLIVATGKYHKFVLPLIESIEKNVLLNNEKKYYVFSDNEIEFGEYKNRCKNLKIEHRPFPYPTMYRFHFFKTHWNELETDQLIYIDADTIVKSEIGTEVLFPVTVTQHCGFISHGGTFERNPISKTFVNVRDQKNYYGGGFYSFSKKEFKLLCDSCSDMIDQDVSNGIIPQWHDESALNKYMSIKSPDRVLSPAYHYPENHEHIYRTWGDKNRFQCKILLLDKNHEEIRS